MIEKLSRRDRIALTCGGVAVLAAILFLGIVEPYREGIERLDGQIATRQRQVQEARELRREVLRLQEAMGEAQRRFARGGDFSLLSFAESLVAEVAGRESLVSMKPQLPSLQEGVREESVEIRLERVDLEQLVRLLFRIDSAEAYLQVKGLRLKTRFDDRSLLDAVLTVAAYGRSA